MVVANVSVDTAMSASDARSSVMARRPANAVAISPWSASTRRMGWDPTSRILKNTARWLPIFSRYKNR